MRSQEEATYSQWLNEDFAWENEQIEEQMRLDQLMEDAQHEAMLDAEITDFLESNCKLVGGCNSEYFVTPEGNFACKKCFVETSWY